MAGTDFPEDASPDGAPLDNAANPPPGATNPESSPPGDPELRPEDWPDSAELASAEPSAHEMSAYQSTLRRVEHMIGVVGVVCALAVAWPLGWPLALGVLAGTALGWINFRWLAASVNAIGERIVRAKSPERGAAVVARGVGRIVLIALIAYVIFSCSVRGLVGYLVGLAMPVIAFMCEAVYEFFAGFRRLS